MHSFKLIRVFGIEIRVDWSWVFIFVLLTWNLCVALSRWHSDWSAVAVVAVSVTAVFAFFGCILLHELAHSLVAVRFGMRVRSITLFLFGGVSNIEHEPRSARVEFLMAIVGPVTSVILGFAFLLLGGGITSMSVTSAETDWTALAGLGPVATLFRWLGSINVLIGLFNLIPGFPLDGGRVLRSALWAATGDLRTATRWASGIGQGIGWGFIVVGIAMAFGVRVPVFGTGLVGGLWLAFIGWFLRTAASQAGIKVAIEDALAGHTVEDLMTRTAPTVSPELPLASLVHDYFIRTDERAVTVVRDDRLVGIVSLSNVRATPTERWATTSVGAVMQSADSFPEATPEEPLAQAFEDLARLDADSLPVLSNGRLVGVLRRQDVARWLELVWRPNAGASSVHAARR
jgi:Zn-dependent protease